MFAVGDKVAVKRPLNFVLIFENDSGAVKQVRECSILLRKEFLVEFLNGESGWYPAAQLKQRGEYNESQA